MRYLLLLVALAGCQAGDAPADLAHSEPASLADAVMASAEAEASAAETVASGPALAMAEAEPGAPSSRGTEASTVEADAIARSTDATSAARLLRRSGDLRVTTEALDETLGEARAIAGRLGGIIAGEDGSAYDGGRALSTLTLRVPSDRFDDAIDALAALGTVESRSVSVDDVTGQIVDVEARLRAQRAAEARYVAFLADANSINEMLSVQERLDRVRSDIESMESVARTLRGQVSLATIRATFVGPATAPAPPPGPGFVTRVVDALALGWHGLLAVVIGVLPLWPLAAVGAAGLAVWRRVARPAPAPEAL